MLIGIAAFEVRYQLRNPVFWVSVFIFALLGFGLTASENVSIGTPGAVHENAPAAIAQAFAIFSLFYQFVITSFVSNAIVRDDATGFGPIVRATRVTRTQFVLGRFLGGLCIALLGFLAVPLGLAVGAAMPWVDPETVGPNEFSRYAWHYLTIAVPNIVLSSAFLFGLATMLRSMMATYIGVVVFVMGYLVVTTVLGARPEYQDVLARFEPLGIGGVAEAIRYWTAAEMNTQLVPLDGNLLFNRALVLVVSIALLALTTWRFSMADRPASRRKLRKLARAEAAETRAAAVAPISGGESVIPRHGAATTRAQLGVRLKTELLQVLKSPGLVVLMLLAVVNTGAVLWFSQTLFGTPSHPLTANVITEVNNGFFLFLLIIAVFYGGELVWRERERKFNEIVDSTPAADWVMIVPKVAAIFLVLLIINLAGMATGIVYQAIKGAAALDAGKYLLWFVLPASVDALLLAILAVFAQVVSPNKYIGWAIMMAWFVSTIVLNNMGFSNRLYIYGASPAEPLSDMNGTGGFWYGALWARVYWSCFALFLMVLAHLLWPRGTDVALRPRLARMRQRLTIGPAIVGAGAIVGAVASGLHFHHNTKVLNVYRTSDEAERLSAEYERKYLKNETLPRPVVTRAVFDAQVFPKERRLDVTGLYDLRNDTKAPITELHITRGSPDVVFPQMALSGASQISNDTTFGYRVFRFAQPLEPGQTARLSFRSRIWHRGFRNQAPATNIVANGTFVNNTEFAPIIGMTRNGLLTDRTKRRQQGLPDELRPAKLEDLSAVSRKYVDADWVTADITVTTDADQVPVAPGVRVSETVRDGRKTARFVSDAPILSFFSIQSARYAIARRNHKGVDLSVYYHPGHEWNVPAMLNALATGLDYFQPNFGPYQFKQARIIEFPGYAQFAQAFANTMPYSESIGFAADVTGPETIDYVSYVTAHELGHQYWAHQVIGANVQGGTVTSETLAQYSALMVMKKLYGPDKIRRFLKYELDQYLTSRKGESSEEVPLYRVENQGYIHYRKGSLVMYLLQERLGEAAVNRALARFIQSWKFKGAPYHRSVDLIAELRKEARSPEDQALITDLFEKITIYDLKVKDASSVRGSNGLWTTTLTVEAYKYYADGKGVEKEAPLAEPIEIGLFTERPGIGAFASKHVLFKQRRPVRGGVQKIVVTSKAKPAFAGVDPYNFYVDRDSDDNVKDVSG